ncbi:lipoprotein-releasing ABC transporter permease subunit [bacterium]|nr:lipoprotein-releasing ABC transporter permease subunit [bacterium]
MPYELYIALRYLRSKRKTGFISLITYISIVGITIGVAALIIVLSVMNGLEREVRSRFLGVDSHLRLVRQDQEPMADYQKLMNQLQGLPHVQAISPYVEGKGLIKSREQQTGVLLRGILEESATQVTDLAKNINFGQLQLGPTAAPGESELPGIVLGFNLADRLMVTVGDKVSIASFDGLFSFGRLPQLMQFRVTGYFETGLFEYDDAYAYVSIPSAQKLCKTGNSVTGLEMRLDHYEKADAVARVIRHTLPADYRPLTWRELNPNLFAWMQIEKWAAFIILCLIILVAAFNILSTLIMVTMEKTREIGILRSMGASQSSIQKIFTFQGALVGVLGTVLGDAIGYTLCRLQQVYKFFSLPTDIYIISWLPVDMKVLDFVFITVAALLISFVAAVLPAARAAALDPVAALRYE